MMLFDPTKPINAGFRTFGMSAIWDPDGSADDISVIPIVGEDEVRFGSLRVSGQGELFKVRVSEIGADPDDKIIEYQGRRLVVKHSEFDDSFRLVLVLDTAPE